MITFDSYPDARHERPVRVHVNSVYVACVVESERRRTGGGRSTVAVIEMADGTRHVVHDGGRRGPRDGLRGLPAQRLRGGGLDREPGPR